MPIKNNNNGYRVEYYLNNDILLMVDHFHDSYIEKSDEYIEKPLVLNGVCYFHSVPKFTSIFTVKPTDILTIKRIKNEN